jgi:Tfp pilus assembly protein PilN
MIAPLNLASRPFRNDRLPAVLMWGAIAVLSVVTLAHGLAVGGLLSEPATTLDREVKSLDAEAEKLRKERESLQAPAPDANTAKQWAVVANLVDRRAFSWSDLLSRLEEVLPPGVRLVSIAPVVRKGEVVLDFAAIARTEGDAWDFVKALQSRKDFADVFATCFATTEEGAEVRIGLKYVPEGRIPAPLPGGR